jgi:neutral ceramidase
VAYSELEIKLRKPNADELKGYEHVVMQTNYEGLQTGHIDETGLTKLYAREQVLLNDLPDSMQFPIQAIKIGSGVIGALGAEMFAETGLWLKENSAAKNYFTICLANGATGYVPPQHEFGNGGYETWRGRTSMLVTNAEDSIKNELIKLVNETN